MRFVRTNSAVLRTMSLAALLFAGTTCSGGGKSLTAPDSPDHAIQGTAAIFYSAADGSAVIQEAELLIDNVRVSHQSFVPGTDRVFFSVGANFNSGGSHRVAIRVIRQNAVSVEYFVLGGISAYRPSDQNSVISYVFGSADKTYTLKAGDFVERVVVVP